MIGYLNGKVLFVRDGWTVIETGGVGYKVNINSDLTAHLHAEENTELYIYTQVREDILALYGFKSLDELDLFEMLISVSGIGPKAALNILSVASIEKIRASIQSQDPTLLSSVSGIGKKTAEKVVIELKNKVGATGNLFIGPKTEDVYEALLQLGFKNTEISSTIAELPDNLPTVEEKLKFCLAKLRK